MWPFKRKPKLPEPPPSWIVEQDLLLQWFPPSSTFTYLGRDCLVTFIWMQYFPWNFAKVHLCADYVDDMGVIHKLVLSFSEAQRLHERRQKEKTAHRHEERDE